MDKGNKKRWKCRSKSTVSLVRPARTYSNGCKSLKRPDNGKYIANGKGVHREVESEGSLRQISCLTYRNLILRLKDVDKFAKQNEVL